jgi:hypothetical protein
MKVFTIGFTKKNARQFFDALPRARLRDKQGGLVVELASQASTS